MINIKYAFQTIVWPIKNAHMSTSPMKTLNNIIYNVIVYTLKRYENATYYFWDFGFIYKTRTETLSNNIYQYSVVLITKKYWR